MAAHERTSAGSPATELTVAPMPISFGRNPRTRIPLLVLGMLALVFGLLAGLARLGIAVPASGAQLAGLHGALLVCGFFGTVISLERAVALGDSWTYLAPAASGAGGVALIAGAPPVAAQYLFILAATLLVAGSIRVVLRQCALFTVMLGAGALAWLAGCLIWLSTGAVSAAVPWWLSFLVLTIAAERLELTRLMPVRPASRPLFIVISLTILAGAVGSAFSSTLGLGALGAGMFALALWLLRYDIARRNLHLDGLARFIAWCLLGGYAWLALGGALALAGAFSPGAPLRDAAIHAITLGFVFSMVFGHAPIIFPAIVQVRIPYLRAFYLPLLALHASLLVRVIGNVWERISIQQAGAIANALVLALFVATMLCSVLHGRRKRRG